MKKYYTFIGYELTLSAGLALLAIVPTAVSAQQNLKLIPPITTRRLNFNNGLARLNDTNFIKQPNPGQNLNPRYNQTPLNHTTIIYPNSKALNITGDSIKYAALDHMPIVTPDMRQYNMPIALPDMRQYGMPVSGKSMPDHLNPK